MTGDGKLQPLGSCQGVTLLSPRDFVQLFLPQVLIRQWLVGGQLGAARPPLSDELRADGQQSNSNLVERP